MADMKPLTRVTARRKIKQSADLCDNINRHLADVYPTYEHTHPKIAEALLAAGQVAEILKSSIEAIRASF